MSTVADTAGRRARAVAAIEALGSYGVKLGLERTELLLEALGSPHRGLRGALVAGTNGKGSVCATLSAMSVAAGRRTVLLAKPHLQRWNERFLVDGSEIDDAEFADLAERVLDAAAGLPADDRPTQFETLTAMGVLLAAGRGETLVCEVGMGGRLDSTNVLDLGVAVVTNISRDHVASLGDTVTAIAAEKAAIIKPGNRCVTAAAEPARGVIAERAAAVGAELRVLERGRDWDGRAPGHDGVEIELRDPSGPLRVRSPLRGEVQCENLAVAAATAGLLGLPAHAITAGAAAARWPGRLQWVDGEPPLLLDGAHNPAAMRLLAGAMTQLVAGRRVVAVFGAMRDKQLEEMLPELRHITQDVVMTSVTQPRAADPRALAELLPGAEAVPDVGAALGRARERAGRDGLVLVCGSLALVGAVLDVLDAERG